MQFVTKSSKTLKRSRSNPLDMPNDNSNDVDDVGSSEFELDEIVKYPLPGYSGPTSVSFSSDDKLVAYLFSPESNLSRKVYCFDVENGEHMLVFSPVDGGLDENNISEEVKLRRERARERGLGVTGYDWVKFGGSHKRIIMVPLPDGVYFYDLSSSKVFLKLPSTPNAPIIDPHLSPDGSMLAFVRDSELHVLDLMYNKEKQLTSGARGSVLTHGLAEYIAQEEMDRKNGYWWSLDSKLIAFTQVDSSEIPLYRIMHQGKNSVGPDTQEDHAYPFTGASNVTVKLGVVSISGGPTTWMDLICGGNNTDQNTDHEYLARVNWMPGNTLIAQVLNRSHTKLSILKFDIKTGQKEVVLVEENTTWVNLHDCFTPLDKSISGSSGGFLWASERTGYRHLYVYDLDGSCVGPITEGDWMVEQIAGVNESTGLVYFTGTLDGVLESNLYCASLVPSGPHKTPVRLTCGGGKHVVVLDHRMERFIDIHDCLESPPRVVLCSLHDGSAIMTLYDQQLCDPRVTKLQLKPPEIVRINANDGTVLCAAMYKPDERRFGPPPYKTMISVYGGPGVQLVSNSWVNTVDMRAQYLRNKGILVWKLDNRGSSRRGLAFEGAIKHKFGLIDTEDQLTGAHWLINQGLAQPSKIGLYGWSYGGYLSAMTLARFPDMFQCAVAGAPVTSWDGYDTFYTEKYMGLPSENPSGYQFGSVMHHVPNLKGQLLIVHGMIDENVHFRHTARLVNALIGAGKVYEILIFPDERHMPRRLSDRIYMEQRIWDFIERSL